MFLWIMDERNVKKYLQIKYFHAETFIFPFRTIQFVITRMIKSFNFRCKLGYYMSGFYCFNRVNQTFHSKRNIHKQAVLTFWREDKQIDEILTDAYRDASELKKTKTKKGKLKNKDKRIMLHLTIISSYQKYMKEFAEKKIT